ncbi:hypothetical protein glysoja_022645 [Glycine soja]|nr:hypothetical protein JHK87_008180 [Glycine soja]KAG5073122.1 hypothetical protein JHK86_008333 [Glycine max]KHN03959.1 hypothetical protein glysoja_022645 [Glycine soja]
MDLIEGYNKIWEGPHLLTQVQKLFFRYKNRAAYHFLGEGEWDIIILCLPLKDMYGSRSVDFSFMKFVMSFCRMRSS